LDGLLAALGATLMSVVAMRKLKIFALATLLLALSVLTPSVAQEYGRLQDGFSSGQYSVSFGLQYLNAD
jgi:hypothetical protein